MLFAFSLLCFGNILQQKVMELYHRKEMKLVVLLKTNLSVQGEGSFLEMLKFSHFCYPAFKET